MDDDGGVLTLLQSNRMVLAMPAHALIGLPDPMQVAQLNPHLQEVIRTKAAKARSWSQFTTALYQEYDAQMKAYDEFQSAKRKAADLYIPILNANRFLALMGYTPDKEK